MTQLRRTLSRLTPSLAFLAYAPAANGMRWCKVEPIAPPKSR